VSPLPTIWEEEVNISISLNAYNWLTTYPVAWFPIYECPHDFYIYRMIPVLFFYFRNNVLQRTDL
jgi:hypothetical protein